MLGAWGAIEFASAAENGIGWDEGAKEGVLVDDDTFARHRDTIMNTGALAARPYGIPSGNHSGSGGV